MERDGSVLVLGPSFVGLGDSAGGQMGEADGALGLVAVLAAGPRCAEGLDAAFGEECIVGEGEGVGAGAQDFGPV